MVVKHVVDRIPAYEVENDANKKRQVLHHAQLLLYLAEPEGEPLRITAYRSILVSLEQNW